MSGQICTVDQRDIDFDALQDEVIFYLKSKDFEFNRTFYSYYKIVCQGSLKISVSFNGVSRSVVITVSYNNKKSNGEPEVLDSDNIREILDFIQEFDED